MLRIDDPLLVSHYATATDTELAGFRSAPHGRICLNGASANRDEAASSNDNGFFPQENAPHNLVYGTGVLRRVVVFLLELIDFRLVPHRNGDIIQPFEQALPKERIGGKPD